MSNTPDEIKKPQSRYVAFSGYVEVDEALDINQVCKQMRMYLAEMQAGISRGVVKGVAMNEDM